LVVNRLQIGFIEIFLGFIGLVIVRPKCNGLIFTSQAWQHNHKDIQQIDFT